MMKFVIGLLSVISLIGCSRGEHVEKSGGLVRYYDHKHNVVCYSLSTSDKINCIKLED